MFLSLPLSGQKEFWFWFLGNKGKKLKANTEGVSRNYKLNLVWVLRENLPWPTKLKKINKHHSRLHSIGCILEPLTPISRGMFHGKAYVRALEKTHLIATKFPYENFGHDQLWENNGRSEIRRFPFNYPFWCRRGYLCIKIPFQLCSTIIRLKNSLKCI